MTVVFGLCFSILGNAETLKKEEARKILLKGEVIGSGSYEAIVRIVLRYKSKIYVCNVVNAEKYSCHGE